MFKLWKGVHFISNQNYIINQFLVFLLFQAASTYFPCAFTKAVSDFTICIYLFFFCPCSWFFLCLWFIYDPAMFQRNFATSIRDTLILYKRYKRCFFTFNLQQQDSYETFFKDSQQLEKSSFDWLLTWRTVAVAPLGYYWKQ